MQNFWALNFEKNWLKLIIYLTCSNKNVWCSGTCFDVNYQRVRFKSRWRQLWNFWPLNFEKNWLKLIIYLTCSNKNVWCSGTHFGVNYQQIWFKSRWRQLWNFWPNFFPGQFQAYRLPNSRRATQLPSGKKADRCCDVCSRKFSNRPNVLRQRTEAHQGVQSYECGFSGKV